MSLNRNRDNDGTAREPLLGDESPMHFNTTWTSTPKYTKYSKLASQADSPELLEYDLVSMQDRSGRIFFLYLFFTFSKCILFLRKDLQMTTMED